MLYWNPLLNGTEGKTQRSREEWIGSNPRGVFAYGTHLRSTLRTTQARTKK
jgi:hypothetical protein